MERNERWNQWVSTHWWNGEKLELHCKKSPEGDLILDAGQYTRRWTNKCLCCCDYQSLQRKKHAYCDWLHYGRPFIYLSYLNNSDHGKNGMKSSFTFGYWIAANFICELNELARLKHLFTFFEVDGFREKLILEMRCSLLPTKRRGSYFNTPIY